MLKFGLMTWIFRGTPMRSETTKMLETIWNNFRPLATLLAPRIQADWQLSPLTNQNKRSENREIHERYSATPNTSKPTSPKLLDARLNSCVLFFFNCNRGFRSEGIALQVRVLPRKWRRVVSVMEIMSDTTVRKQDAIENKASVDPCLKPEVYIVRWYIFITHEAIIRVCSKYLSKHIQT